MRKNEFAEVPIEEAEFCVIDVETTGLNSRLNNIIEIGLVKVSNLEITDTFQSLINPGRDIPYFITQFTGITNDDVFEAPFFDELAEKILKFIDNKILVAHNLSFDHSFLKKELIISGFEDVSFVNLCTLKLAKKIYPELRSKSLASVTRHLRLRNLEAHRALSDAKVTARVLIKMLKELKNKHGIYNTGEIINFQYMPKTSGRKTKIKKSLLEDTISLPGAPGIYYFLNSKDEIIYIGKAKSLKNRIKSYFSPTAPRKAKKIIQQASKLKIEVLNSELTALLTEAESIKLIKPKHNTQLKSYGNKYFLRINRTHKFPDLEICNYFDFDGNDYFGLFSTKKKAIKVYEMILKTFSIRECTEKELSKNKACFLAEIERCIAPCVNKDQNVYGEEIERVYEFLYGKNQFALNRLLNKMKEYSSKEKYEKAAEVKEVIDLILSQTHKTSLLAEPVNSANILIEINEGFEKDFILMLSGKIYIKKYTLFKNDHFEESVDDYFERTKRIDLIPTEEDLEKMKIMLNWLIKNRNKVRIFYLKDYNSKHELYSELSQFNKVYGEPLEATFDIKNFINADVVKSN